MPRQYDTYGFHGTTLEDAAGQVGHALGISLEERDSSYYAGTYYLHRKGAGSALRIFNNYDPISRQTIRGQYQGFDVILEISNMDDMDRIRGNLAGVTPPPVLLSSKIVPDENPEDEV